MDPESQFLRLLREQVGHEFDAHQQYVAIAVWFDSQDLPQLARHYYRQALEERNHAMMTQVLVAAAYAPPPTRSYTPSAPRLA